MYSLHKMAHNVMAASAATVLNYSYNKCFEIIRADTDELREQVFRLRYQVFCVENPFENPAEHPDGMERDAYDARAHHILLRHRATGQNAGTIRVVMPDAQNLSRSFPLQAVCGEPFIRRPENARSLCEISRLCVSNAFRRRRQDGSIYPAAYQSSLLPATSLLNQMLTRRAIPYAPMGLFRGAFQLIIELGRVDCIAVMEPRLIRTICSLGFACEKMGPEIDFHGIRQPVMFNLRHVYDNGVRKGALFYNLMSNHGRLHKMALKNELQNGTVFLDYLNRDTDNVLNTGARSMAA